MTMAMMVLLAVLLLLLLLLLLLVQKSQAGSDLPGLARTACAA